MLIPEFTPDGGFIDYLERVNPTDKSLYQIPVLGGTPRKLVDHVVSATMVSKANLPSSSPILLALMKPIWLPAASAMTSVLLTFLPGRRTAGPLPFRLPIPPPTACTSIC